MNDWERSVTGNLPDVSGQESEGVVRSVPDTQQRQGMALPSQWITFHTPSQCREYQPPEGYVLVGDCHIMRGNITLIAGAAGIGKSRAATALAVAGATAQDWFGLPVHGRFKTAILQAENGRYRLKNEFAELADASDCELDKFIRVSEPPPYGMVFRSLDFRQYLATWLEDFRPDVLVLDPWNNIAHDDGQRDYREALDNIRASLPKGDAAPAVVIVAHTRKPKIDGRPVGRALLNEVSGSHVIGSAARCVFVMEAASDDQTDTRVVWTCAKNNDGEPGPRSAWHRRNGLFTPCHDLNWEGFDNPQGEERASITETHMRQLFANGRRLPRRQACEKLMAITELGQSACYNALSPSGRFKERLREEGKLLAWLE